MRVSPTRFGRGNLVYERKSGGKNLRIFLIEVHLLVIVLHRRIYNLSGWAKFEFGLRIKKIVSLRISLVRGNLLFVKCNQALIKCPKTIYSWSMCKFLCLRRVPFCLNKANPWFGIKGYGKRSSQKALGWFISLWVFILRNFNYLSIFKKTIPPHQMESWTKCLGFFMFCHSWGNCIFFSLSFFRYFG